MKASWYFLAAVICVAMVWGMLLAKVWPPIILALLLCVAMLCGMISFIVQARNDLTSAKVAELEIRVDGLEAAKKMHHQRINALEQV